MKKMFSFIVPLILAVTMTVLLNNILDKQIKKLSETKDLSELSSEYGDTIKDKGIMSKDILAKNNDLFLMGSSEMAIDVPENAVKLFPLKGADYNVSCFGRGYVQNLQQATALGGSNIDGQQKIAYILSLQWFDNKEGVSANKFAMNFSDIQFYKFLDNEKISDENKKYYAERVYDLLKKANKFEPEQLYCKLYLNDSFFSKCEMFIMKPYFKISKYLTNIKDKALTYKKLTELPDKEYTEESELEEINWDAEGERLSQRSEQLQTTNRFMLKDKYYDDNIKSQLENLKDKLKSQDMNTSVEMQDFKFYLSVCNDLGIKPYIIMPPVNGWYYDYLGLDSEKRNEFYDYIDNLCTKNNIDILDLRGYEYKKGFLCDVMHLGSEGWLEVSEGIYKYFNK